LDKVAGNRFEVRKVSLRIGAGEGRGQFEQPRPQRAANVPEIAALALLYEVDDVAIVGILADREINPVPVPVDGDDNRWRFLRLGLSSFLLRKGAALYM
jgi:hypothetical protein